MESKGKMELIQLAVQQLMEEQRGKEEKKSSNSSSEESSGFVVADDSDDNCLQLSNLISQLETLKEEQQLSTASKTKAEADKDAIDNDRGGETEAGNNGIDEDAGGRGERIDKALEEIKRQNFVTHCLVSAMIVLTLVWQLSEVSLALKVKDGISHPFRSLGNMLGGMLKGPSLNVQNGNKQNSADELEDEAPGLVISEIPHLGFDKNED